MRDPPGQGQGGEILLAIWFIPGPLWPVVTTLPLNLSINEKRDTSHHQTCSTKFTVIQRRDLLPLGNSFNKLWPVSDCSRNESRLVTCGEGEVCATLIQHHRPDSGSCRHHQNYFIWAVKSIFWLSVKPLTPNQQRPLPMSWLRWQRDIHCVKMQIISGWQRKVQMLV